MLLGGLTGFCPSGRAVCRDIVPPFVASMPRRWRVRVHVRPVHDVRQQVRRDDGRDEQHDEQQRRPPPSHAPRSLLNTDREVFVRAPFWAPAFRAARISAIVISSGISNASMSTVSLRLRRVEYCTRSFASLSNRASCISPYHSTSLVGRNWLMLSAPNKFRCKSAIETVSKRKRMLLFQKTRSQRTVENSAHHLLILLRLEAAGAVNKHTLRL